MIIYILDICQMTATERRLRALSIKNLHIIRKQVFSLLRGRPRKNPGQFFFFLFQKERQLFRQDPNMADCLIKKLPALTIYLRIFHIE